MNDRTRKDMLIRLLPALVTASLCLTGAAVAADQDPYALVARGNEAVTAGQFDEAIELYGQAAKALPDSPELAYNRAVAHYRKGEWTQAADLFSQALLTRDPTLEAKVRFNLGNCAYAEALSKKDSPPEAIKVLDEAIGHFRQAVKANPADPDPRANLETAALLLKQLKEQQQEQEQQQQDQQNPSSQPESQPESRPSSQPESQPSSQPEDEQSKQQQQQDAQKQEGGESKEEQAAQDQQQKDEPKEGKNLEAANEQKEGDEDQEAKPAKPVEMKLMSREEAEKLLQIIRDRERQRREELARQQQQQARPTPAEKDW